VARLAVGEYEYVFALGGMLEKIIDAVLFHKPANEIVVSLAILHAIFERWRGTGGRVAKIAGTREATIGEHLLDDVQGRHLGEDPAIRGSRQQPKPRAQDDLIEMDVLPCAGPAGLGNHSVEITVGVVASLMLDDTV
jgi:hypothetical protein